MKLKILTHVAVLGLGLALVAGCESSGRAQESEKAVQSISDVNASLAKAKDVVNNTVMQLDLLQKGADLQGTFKQYISAVSDVKSVGDKAAQRGQDMRDKREEYMAKWQAEAAQIQNPDIKASLEDRRMRVKADYDKVAALGDEVKTAYQPFLAGLQEVQKALSIDLTPDGVKGMKPSIDKSKADGATLNKKIDALSAELNVLVGKMQPPPSTPPAKAS